MAEIDLAPTFETTDELFDYVVTRDTCLNRELHPFQTCSVFTAFKTRDLANDESDIDFGLWINDVLVLGKYVPSNTPTGAIGFDEVIVEDDGPAPPPVPEPRALLPIGCIIFLLTMGRIVQSSNFSRRN